MNPLEQLVQDELNRLVDRLAATAREGTVAGCAGQHPEVRARIEQAEARLSSARCALLEGYAVWREALSECGDLWALADLAAERPAASVEARAA